MYDDYLRLIVETYKRKKSTNALQPRFNRTTPAKLKKECMTVCNERYSPRDEKIFRTFFEKSGDKKTTLEAIEQCKTDRLRPLNSFLKGETPYLGDENIELLGWLIDFEPRPYDERIKYEYLLEKLLNDPSIDSPVEKPKIAETSPVPRHSGEDNNGGKPKSLSPLSKGQFIINSHKMLIAAILVIVMGSLIYWSKKKTSSSESCMYWAGDHYERISCDQKIPNKQSFALDPLKLKDFKKITKPDTITYASIGIVWYTKIKKDSLEYYTGQGLHPIDSQRWLKPITKYIIDTHIIKKYRPLSIPRTESAYKEK